MTKAVPEQKREINHQARSHGRPDPEDLGASGTHVEDSQSGGATRREPQQTVAQDR